MVDNIREQVLEYLKLISSESELRSYDKEAPGLVLTECLCMWFDDLLHGKTPVEFRKAIYNEAFTEKEIQSLDEFHQYFEECTETFSDTHDLSKLLENSAWKNIMKKAVEVLKILESYQK